MKAVLFAIVGVGAGAVGMWLWTGASGVDREAEVASALADRESELAEVRRKYEEKSEELVEARKRIAELDGEREVWLAKQETAKQKNEGQAKEGNNFGKAMDAWGKLQASSEKEQLEKMLGLNSVQAEAFEEAMANLQEERNGAYAKMFTGQASFREFAIMDGAMPQVDAFAQEFLNEEQLESYEEYKVRREADRVERNANEELMHLQMMVSLTDEQKDAAFDIFANFASNESPDTYVNTPPGNEVEAFRGEFLEPRIEAMADILTPEQHRTYIEQTEVMMNMMTGGFSNEGAGNSAK